MSDWYIARNHEQEGPYGVDQINELLKRGEISRDRTLVWRKGMSAWMPISKSSILDEINTTQSAQTKLPSSSASSRSVLNPYVPPAAPATNNQTHAYKYPGIGRVVYIISYGLIWLSLWVMAFLVEGFESEILGDKPTFLVIFLLMLLMLVYIDVKRLHNLGMSGWAYLWNLVPIMNIWINWRIIACPAGYDHHRQLDIPGKIITWGIIGLCALPFVLIIFGVLMNQ